MTKTDYYTKKKAHQVPAAKVEADTILSKAKTKKHPWFPKDKEMTLYRVMDEDAEIHDDTGGSRVTLEGETRIQSQEAVGFALASVQRDIQALPQGTPESEEAPAVAKAKGKGKAKAKAKAKAKQPPPRVKEIARKSLEHQAALARRRAAESAHADSALTPTRKPSPRVATPKSNQKNKKPKSTPKNKIKRRTSKRNQTKKAATKKKK